MQELWLVAAYTRSDDDASGWAVSWAGTSEESARRSFRNRIGMPPVSSVVLLKWEFMGGLSPVMFARECQGDTLGYVHGFAFPELFKLRLAEYVRNHLTLPVPVEQDPAHFDVNA